MHAGNTLTVVIPLVVIGYALWLVVRMVRDRKKGRCSLGSCAGCPLEDGCKTAGKVRQKQGEDRDE